MICETCIHNAVCKYGEARSNGIYCMGEKCKQYQSTADVVPKSEVEELIKSVDDMLDLVCAMTGLELTYYGKYAKLKKKYTEGNDE